MNVTTRFGASDRRRLTRGMLIALLGALAIAVSWPMFQAASQATPPAPKDGWFNVGTTLPDVAVASVTLDVATDRPNHFELSVMARTRDKVIPKVVWLDVQLGGAAAISCDWPPTAACKEGLGDLPIASDAGWSEDITQDGAWVMGNVSEAYFVRETKGWTATRIRIALTPEHIDFVDSHSGAGWQVFAKVFVPASGPLLIDTGPEVTTSFPAVLPSWGMYSGRPTGGDIRGDLTAGGTLPGPKEMYPLSSDSMATFEAALKVEPRLRLVEAPGDPEVTAETVTWSPVEAWATEQRTMFRARFDAPAWRAQASKVQFLAGLAAGIGSALLVWGLEMTLPVDRPDPPATPRRRVRRPRLQRSRLVR